MGLTAAVAVGAAVTVIPTVAAREKPPQADVLRGSVLPIPYGHDAGGLMKKLRGRARLVDGSGRDRITIRVRGLERRTTYLWHIHAVDAKTPDPCAAHRPVPLARGFKRYPRLVADRRGRARARATARRFKAKADKTYYVNVDRRRDGTSIGCGVLEAPAPKATPTPTPGAPGTTP